jgi:hypothetical protein
MFALSRVPVFNPSSKFSGDLLLNSESGLLQADKQIKRIGINITVFILVCFNHYLVLFINMQHNTRGKK